MLGSFASLVAVWIVTGPASRALEGTSVALGVCMFLSPWLLGPNAAGMAAWNDWMVGAAVAALAASAYRNVPAAASPRP